MEKRYLGLLFRLILTWTAIIVTHTLIYALLPGNANTWMIGEYLHQGLTVDPGTLSKYQQLRMAITGALQLKFGDSLFYHQPVLTLIAKQLPSTFIFALHAFLLKVAFAFLLSYGRLQASRFAASIYHGVKSMSAFPSFFLYTLLFMLGLTQYAYPMALTIIVMKQAATLSQFINTLVSLEIEKGYYQLAIEREISPIKRCGFLLRNALIPVWIKLPKNFCHLLFYTCPIIELLFHFEGFGQLSFMAMKRLDYPLMLGCLSLSSMIISLAYWFENWLQQCLIERPYDTH